MNELSKINLKKTQVQLMYASKRSIIYRKIGAELCLLMLRSFHGELLQLVAGQQVSNCELFADTFRSADAQLLAKGKLYS